jgi:hypothetical protein
MLSWKKCLMVLTKGSIIEYYPLIRDVGEPPATSFFEPDATHDRKEHDNEVKEMTEDAVPSEISRCPHSAPRSICTAVACVGSVSRSSKQTK